MKSSDPLLWGIVAGIGALVLIALVVAVAVGRGDAQKVAEDTPEGVVHNYVQAVRQRQYEVAYAYLSNSLDVRPSQDIFVRDLQEMQSYRDRFSVGMTVRETRITNDTAWVSLTVTEVNLAGDPGSLLFEPRERSREETATLRRENGQWKLTRFFYPYWSGVWEGPRKVPEPAISPAPH